MEQQRWYCLVQRSKPLRVVWTQLSGWEVYASSVCQICRQENLVMLPQEERVMTINTLQAGWEVNQRHHFAIGGGVKPDSVEIPSR